MVGWAALARFDGGLGEARSHSWGWGRKCGPIVCACVPHVFVLCARFVENFAVSFFFVSWGCHVCKWCITVSLRHAQDSGAKTTLFVSAEKRTSRFCDLEPYLGHAQSCSREGIRMGRGLPRGHPSRCTDACVANGAVGYVVLSRLSHVLPEGVKKHTLIHPSRCCPPGAGHST